MVVDGRLIAGENPALAGEGWVRVFANAVLEEPTRKFFNGCIVFARIRILEVEVDLATGKGARASSPGSIAGQPALAFISSVDAGHRLRSGLGPRKRSHSRGGRLPLREDVRDTPFQCDVLFKSPRDYAA